MKISMNITTFDNNNVHLQMSSCHNTNIKSFQIVIRYDHEAGHERSKSFVARRVSRARNGCQGAPPEISIGKHVFGLVARYPLDIVCPLPG